MLKLRDIKCSTLSGKLQRFYKPRAGVFSFTYSLYMYESDSLVGASCARDLPLKPLTFVNANRSQNRKLNSPEASGRAI